MPQPIVTEIDNYGDGQKLIWFRDITSPSRALITTMEEANVNPDAFRDIANNMPRFTVVQLDWLREKFDHYLESSDVHSGRDSGKDMHALVREIASTDMAIVKRVEVKTKEAIGDIAKFLKIDKIVRGKNEDGTPAIAIIYKTSRKPESPYNEYNEETGVRITWTSGSYNEEYLEQVGSFLSGEFNVPFMDHIPD